VCFYLPLCFSPYEPAVVKRPPVRFIFFVGVENFIS
jgi:hypothetical protein